MTTSNTIDSPQAAPKGYWTVFATVKEPSRFSNYTSVAGPLIASHGGRVLARGEMAVVVEGSMPGRPRLIEFPSYAAAHFHDWVLRSHSVHTSTRALNSGVRRVAEIGAQLRFSGKL